MRFLRWSKGATEKLFAKKPQLFPVLFFLFSSFPFFDSQNRNHHQLKLGTQLLIRKTIGEKLLNVCSWWVAVHFLSVPCLIFFFIGQGGWGGAEDDEGSQGDVIEGDSDFGWRTSTPTK